MSQQSSNNTVTSVFSKVANNSNILLKLSILLTIIAVAIVPHLTSAYYTRIVFLMIMWVGLGTSWNILGGYVGYPSFGHVAFLGIGGFTVGLIGNQYNMGGSISELLALLILAGMLAAAFAAIIAYPLLRLRGGYFAISTLGVAVVLRELFKNVDALGGGIGISSPNLEVAMVDPLIAQYYLMALITLLTVTVAHVVKTSKIGYGFAAIREGEDAAKMLGVPTVRYKIIGFVISSFFPGVIGGLYVYFLGYFTASSLYSVTFSVDMILYTVIGGLGTLGGPIIGAPLMVFLSRIALEGLLKAHVFVTGLFIVVVMMFFPRGIVGVTRDIVDQFKTEEK